MIRNKLPIRRSGYGARIQGSPGGWSAPCGAPAQLACLQTTAAPASSLESGCTQDLTVGAGSLWRLKAVISRTGDAFKETRIEETRNYSGSCFCGTVQFTISGEPAPMGYCHCDSCRRWSAAPVNAFTLWKPDAVRITRGRIEHRHLQPDPAQLPHVVQDLRRACLHRTSRHGSHRRVRGCHSWARVPSGPARQLSGAGLADCRRIAQTQGCSRGDGWFRRIHCSVSASRIARPSFA